MDATILKIIAVGDANTGKKSLFQAYTGNAIELRHVSFEEQIVTTLIDRVRVRLLLWNISGLEAPFMFLNRYMAYEDADIALMCFSIGNPDTLNNISNIWVPEVRTYSPDAMLLLLGNKQDLRDDEDAVDRLRAISKTPVKRGRGQQVADAIEATKYMECSAINYVGVDAVFHSAIRSLLKTRPERCTLQ